MTLHDLHGLCVAPFQLSSTRAPIIAGLTEVIERLSDSGVVGEVWVDGSFVTEKMDPKDVDIVLRVSGEWYDAASQAQRDAVDWLATDLKTDFLCDSYYFHVWENGHPLYWYGETMYAYWMRQWAFDRSDNMKGMAVIAIGGASNV